MVLAQKQKYRPMEQDRKSETNSCTCSQLSNVKEARIYNGAKKASSVSDSEKTGQLCVKEIRTVPHAIHKDKLKMD